MIRMSRVFQTIRMNNERFAVPEILLHPSDVGIQEMGIPEAIHHSIGCLPPGACVQASFSPLEIFLI